MRQIVVIGLGQFGSHFARELTGMKCEVLALDIDEDKVSLLRDDVQQAVICDARSLEAIRAVVSTSVDEVMVCLGNQMEASILCTLHLSQIGVRRIRTTAINKDHALILKAVGAHEVIFPEQETAERTARRVAYPSLLDYFPFEEDHRILEIALPSKLIGQMLKESRLRENFNLLVLAIKSGTSGEFQFMPAADTILSESDRLIVLGREVNLARFSVLE
ncbi:MAG: potassium channel family protein [Phycisphaerae bacterium]